MYKGLEAKKLQGVQHDGGRETWARKVGWKQLRGLS